MIVHELDMDVLIRDMQLILNINNVLRPFFKDCLILKG